MPFFRIIERAGNIDPHTRVGLFKVVRQIAVRHQVEPIEFHRTSLEFKSLHCLGLLSGLALSPGISKVGTESDKGRSPAASLGWGIMKVMDKWEPLQECADIFALDASALAVDQPHYGEASRPTLYEIFLDDTTDFLWSKRV